MSEMPYLTAMKLYRLATPFEATTNRSVYWTFAIAWILLAPFFAWGMITAWGHWRVPAIVLLAPVVATIGTAILFYGCIRFRDAIAPVLVVFAVAGLIDLLERLGPSSEQGVR